MVTDPAGWLGLAGGGDGGEGDDDLVILAPLGRDSVTVLVVEDKIGDATNAEEATWSLPHEFKVFIFEHRIGHALDWPDSWGAPVDEASCGLSWAWYRREHGCPVLEGARLEPLLVHSWKDPVVTLADGQVTDDIRGLLAVCGPLYIDRRFCPREFEPAAVCRWIGNVGGAFVVEEQDNILNFSLPGRNTPRATTRTGCPLVYIWGKNDLALMGWLSWGCALGIVLPKKPCFWHWYSRSQDNIAEYDR